MNWGVFDRLPHGVYNLDTVGYLHTTEYQKWQNGGYKEGSTLSQSHAFSENQSKPFIHFWCTRIPGNCLSRPHIWFRFWHCCLSHDLTWTYFEVGNFLKAGSCLLVWGNATSRANCCHNANAPLLQSSFHMVAATDFSPPEAITSHQKVSFSHHLLNFHQISTLYVCIIIWILHQTLISRNCKNLM